MILNLKIQSYCVLSSNCYHIVTYQPLVFSVGNKYRVLSYATGWTYPVLFTGVIIILALVQRDPMDTGAGILHDAHVVVVSTASGW